MAKRKDNCKQERKERKIWHHPSFVKLKISQTLAGGGSYENDNGQGNGPEASSN